MQSAIASLSESVSMSACKLLSAASAITLAALALHFEYVSALKIHYRKFWFKITSHHPYFALSSLFSWIFSTERDFPTLLCSHQNSFFLPFSRVLPPSEERERSLGLPWAPARGVNCYHSPENANHTGAKKKRKKWIISRKSNFFKRKNNKSGWCWKNMDNFHEVRKDILKFFCLQYIRKVLPFKFTTPE